MFFIHINDKKLRNKGRTKKPSSLHVKKPPKTFIP